jgi:uncharacterized C2H2 Zn-finger protein
MNTENFTYWYLMLGNFFRRLKDYKQRVNKTQNVEINSPGSSGGQGK